MTEPDKSPVLRLTEEEKQWFRDNPEPPANKLTEEEKQWLRDNPDLCILDKYPIGADPIPTPATPVIPTPAPVRAWYMPVSDEEDEDEENESFDYGWVDGPDPDDVRAFTKYGGPYRDSTGRVRP